MTYPGLRPSRLTTMPRPEWQAFYNSKAWKKVRRAQFDHEPLCRECRKQGRLVPAEDVDHIIQLEDGGAPLDPENLQSLCHSHHSEKTARDRLGHGYSKAVGADGFPLDAAHPFNQ